MSYTGVEQIRFYIILGESALKIIEYISNLFQIL